MSDPLLYRTREGDTADSIAFSYYGKTDGTLETLIDANPGLANFDVIPAGVMIQLPPSPAPAEKPAEKLWS